MATQTRKRASRTTRKHHNGAADASEKKRREQHGEPWRPASTVEDNPIGLSREVVEQLIPRLDELQASLWILYHQYHKHHWLVEGPQFMELHLFLEGHYQQVHKYIDALAERITALGGIPTSDPANQAAIAFLTHEPEGTYRIRESLQHDRTAEGQVALRLRETIRQALDLGDFGTKRLLEKVLLATEERAHHLDHFLGEDTLEIGLIASEKDVTA